MSLLADLLSTLIDRRMPDAWAVARSDGRPIDALCRDLIGSQGEVSGYALARQILDRYRGDGRREKAWRFSPF